MIFFIIGYNGFIDNKGVALTDPKINKIIDFLSLEFHRFKRYGTPATLVIVITQSNEFFSAAKSGIRRLDIITQISPDMYAIVYAHTGQHDAERALDNIFGICKDFDVEYRVGVCEVDKSDVNELDVVTRVFEKIEKINFYV